MGPTYKITEMRNRTGARNSFRLGLPEFQITFAPSVLFTRPGLDVLAILVLIISPSIYGQNPK